MKTPQYKRITPPTTTTTTATTTTTTTAKTPTLFREYIFFLPEVANLVGWEQLHC